MRLQLRLLVVTVVTSLATCIAVAQVLDSLYGPFREAKKIVLSELRDPDSAQLRNLKDLAKDKRVQIPMLIVCAELNAKNETGGFTGFIPIALFRPPSASNQTLLYAKSAAAFRIVDAERSERPVIVRHDPFQIPSGPHWSENVVGLPPTK